MRGIVIQLVDGEGIMIRSVNWAGDVGCLDSNQVGVMDNLGNFKTVILVVMKPFPKQFARVFFP